MIRKIVILFSVLLQFYAQSMEIEATEKIDFYEFTKKNYMFSLEVPKEKLEDKSYLRMIEEKIKQDNANKYAIKDLVLA